MKKYGVKLRVSGEATVYVEADDQMEAIEKAKSEVGLMELDSIKVEEAKEVWIIPPIHRVA